MPEQITWRRVIRVTGPSLVGRLSMSNDSGAVDAPGVGGDAFGWELAVADQVVVNREFEQPVEDEVAAPRSPSVEAENEFVEIALEVSVPGESRGTSVWPTTRCGCSPDKSAPTSSPAMEAAHWLLGSWR